MTNREFYTVVKEANISEEATAHAERLIEQLDKRNAARAEKPSKKEIENAPIRKAILEIVTEAEEAMTAKAVAEAYEAAQGTAITTQKASALLTQLVKEGAITKTDGKKGKLYSVENTEVAQAAE